MYTVCIYVTTERAITLAKLQNSGFSNFRGMYRKPSHIISEPTVRVPHRNDAKIATDLIVETKYIKTCTELSHPGCLLLQFYALNHVFIPIDCLTLVCFTDLHVHLFPPPLSTRG